MRANTLVLLLSGALLLPVAALAQTKSTASMEETRDQGILYFKKDRFKLAKVRLDQAFKLGGGAEDFQTVFYRGRAAHKILLLEAAFDMAELAVKLAGDNKKKKAKVAAFKEELAALYGGVTIKAAEGETNKKGRIFLEAKTGIINKEKKRVFLSIRERFRSTDIEVPTTIYLPYGDYLANNVPFAIEQGKERPTVEVFLQIVVGPEESKLWWYVGAAGAAAVAAGVAAFLIFDDPKPVTEQRAVVEVRN